MKKRIILSLLAGMLTMSSFAQFECGKKYIGASLSGFDLSYNGSEKGNLGLSAKVGYLFVDDLMATASIAYDKQNDVPAAYSFGVGARYYIIQNGLFLGASVDYRHATKDFNDLMPSVQVGYAFFLSKTVTVEPEAYYEQSFKNHSDYSKIGFRVGVGVYL